MTGVFAHVKWFTDPSRNPTDYGALLTLPVLAAFAVALAAVAVAWWIQRHIPEPRAIRGLERFASATPLGLRACVGVALVVAAAARLLFVPSLRLEPDLLGNVIVGLEALAGMLLAAGLFTRLGAAILALLGVLAMSPFSFEAILEQVHLLGVAAFLLLVGPGPVSIHRLRGTRPAVVGRGVPAAALTLVRVAMGFGIAYSALTEKLLNQPLALTLLRERPELNVLRGFGLADESLVYLAGVTELTIGIVILSGHFTRPVIAVGAVLFTISLLAFGWPELLGHLPYYGIMLTLLIAPEPGSRRVREALRPAA